MRAYSSDRTVVIASARYGVRIPTGSNLLGHNVQSSPHGAVPQATEPSRTIGVTVTLPLGTMTRQALGLMPVGVHELSWAGLS